jgi:hypothetical protein
MEATQRTDNPRQQAEPVYLESTLLRVLGVAFCHDPKRARTRTGKIEINRGVAEKGITVRFDPEYAQPGPFAHRVAMAVIRKAVQLRPAGAKSDLVFATRTDPDDRPEINGRPAERGTGAGFEADPLQPRARPFQKTTDLSNTTSASSTKFSLSAAHLPPTLSSPARSSLPTQSSSPSTTNISPALITY